MKYILAVLAASLGLSVPLIAQDSAALPPELQEYINTSRSSHAKLLQDSSEILKRLGFIEQSLQAPIPTTPISALEARLAELEAKLATAPTPAVITATEGAATPTEELEALQKNLNYAWIVITAALVFFMQAGFGLSNSASHAPRMPSIFA